MIDVLQPTPDYVNEARPLCAPAGSILGKKIGLRRDYWRSWDYVTDEWAQLLEKDGALPFLWRAPVSKGNEEAAHGSEAFDQFLRQSDIVITGLCSCGGCTMWAIHDGVGALNRGIPTLVTCTEQFEPLARSLAKLRGHGEIRLERLPFPLEGRPEEEVRQIARDHYESMLEALGVEL